MEVSLADWNHFVYDLVRSSELCAMLSRVAYFMTIHVAAPMLHFLIATK